MDKKEFSRYLRRHQTDAERIIWKALRNRQLYGFKFRRQHPIGPYILDFYCHQARLDVEIDGGQHYTDDGIRRDEERDAELEQQGIKVLRYSNSEVLNETDSVVEEIFEEVHQRIKNETND